MRRGDKPVKAKGGAKLPVNRKAPTNKNRGVRDLEQRLSEALEQRTATADILRVIASAPTDLQPVLDAVAANAARVCGAYDATIVLRDGDVVRRVAHHGPIPESLPKERPLSSGFASNRAIAER